MRCRFLGHRHLPLLFCLLAIGAGRVGGAEQGDRSNLRTVMPTADSRLENVLRVGARALSGSEPKTAASFRWLRQQGVATVVSVDRMSPDVELARRHSLGYVHIPLGYDGIDRASQLAIVRLMSETKGLIYFHCHHGRHRGPAATAIACLADGSLSKRDADKFLKRAGTGKNYLGLWRDVASFRLPDPGSPLPSLHESVNPPPLSELMAKIDRNWDAIEAHRESGTLMSKSTVAQTLLLVEGLRESHRFAHDQYDAQFTKWLSQAVESAAGLGRAIKRSHRADAEKAFAELKKSCVQCHSRYRD